MIRTFLLVLRRRTDTKLLMVGEGTARNNLETLAVRLGIRKNIVFTDRVPQSEIPDYIAAAEIGVSPIPPLTFYKFSSPIKMVEYMASAKPVVANEEIPDHKEALEKSGGGLLVPFRPEAFADAILHLLDNPQKAVEMGERGRKWVMQYRSFDVLARQLEKRYLQIISQHAEIRGRTAPTG